MAKSDGKDGAQSSKSDKPSPEGNEVSASVWKSSERVVRHSFPGPREATALLRVAVDRSAYAELIAHAKESLDREICGALVGRVCEDDRGIFVYVAAGIRGSTANQGSTHVTFTQETWNGIHKSLERDYPEFQMIGWYHSHPGFGVEFSEMDLFIQKNFFPAPTQIALVLDPLSGAVAICVNTSSGIQYIERFWVDGREQPCQMPKPQVGSGATNPTGGPVTTDGEPLRALEARVSQLVQQLDEQRLSYQRFLFFIGTVVCLGAIACFGYNYYSQIRYRNELPRVNQVVPIPVQVGDKTVMLGVGLVEWQVPEELKAANVALEKERRLAEEVERDPA